MANSNIALPDGPTTLEFDGWTGADHQVTVVRAELEELCDCQRPSSGRDPAKCSDCRGRGYRLTADGRRVLAFVRRWSA